MGLCLHGIDRYTNTAQETLDVVPCFLRQVYYASALVLAQFLEFLSMFRSLSIAQLPLSGFQREFQSLHRVSDSPFVFVTAATFQVAQHMDRKHSSSKLLHTCHKTPANPTCVGMQLMRQSFSMLCASSVGVPL